MADETVALIANLLRDQRGPLVEALRWATVFMSEIERENRAEMFDGEKIKVPIVLAPQGGSGMTTEAGLLNTTRSLSHTNVRIDNGIAHIPISFTTKAVLAAKGDAQSWINLIPDKMDMAEQGLRRIINEQFLGNGDALIASVTGSTGASGVTNQTALVGTTANFYQLYAERYVDVLVRATAAVKATGVKILDYDDVAGTVTTNSSGTGYATTNADGIYIEGSWGNALQGMSLATATTGTFQTLDKALTQAWRGTDVSPAVAGTDPTLSVFAKAERKAAQRSGTTPDFYVGDPAVIDKFEQIISLQANWAGQTGTLETGWEGIKYRGKVFIREFDCPASTMFGVKKADIHIYAREQGPDWDEIGGMGKRFARSLPFEYWLIWMLQLAFHRCNSQVKIGNLSVAT